MVLGKKIDGVITYTCEKCGKILLEKYPNGKYFIHDGCKHYIWHIIPFDYYKKQNSTEGKLYVRWLKHNNFLEVYSGKEVYFLMPA
jgi:hypothetical protein